VTDKPWTPGPWRAADRMVIVVAETHGYDTCIANTAIGGSGAQQQRANARLVAAAPALFDALQETWRVLRAAGLSNLTRGVQLGQTSWYVKASNAEAMADAALASARDAQHDSRGRRHRTMIARPSILPDPPYIADAFGNGVPPADLLSASLDRMVDIQCSAYPDHWSDEDRREMAELHLFGREALS
jgi:hypothetical protein